MKLKKINKDFIEDFMNESCKVLENKIKEMENKINELDYDEDSSVNNWNGYGDEDEDFDAMEFFGDAGDAAEKDIKDELRKTSTHGEDDFTSFGTMEDPRMLKKLLRKEVRNIFENEEYNLEAIIRQLKASGNNPTDEEIENIKGAINISETEEIDEERIANPKSKKYVNKLKNFIGSHIYGEDLGNLGEMYVAYSYGEQFPVYLNYKGKWYHNTDNYKVDDEKVNNPTEKHKKDMKPSKKTKGISLTVMQSMIKAFKKKNNLGDNVHKDVEPGEKN